ncbi:hypothetical protein EUGRSUZ_C01378 [Eucalyptus grandis]|uniref:Uncharacterized protein n=2 Tax=Eucalyptus grandis TaxID=71139 RepID=A0ACC3LDI7_EUCGR|nr:hypothetical protein EUGRSUZ_C01378 [Eucalyptus grandis]
MVCSCLLLYAMRFWDIISFSAGETQSVSYNPATMVPHKTLLHTIPLAVSYLLYMLASMESIRGVNVPMYTTLRRTTVAFTMVVEYFLTRQRYSHPVVGRDASVWGSLYWALLLLEHETCHLTHMDTRLCSCQTSVPQYIWLL